MNKHHCLAIVLVITAIAFPGFAPDALAACPQDDFICEKFARKKASEPESRRRASTVRRPRRTEPRTLAVKPPSPADAPAPATAAPVKTSMNTAIPVAPVPLSITTLSPGAIAEAPVDTSNLIFGSGDQIEMATARCEQIESSKRRISCAVAIHQLALNGEAGSGCTGSLDLRRLEFVRADAGDWVSEDSITLCGGRLLRRTELFPVALNGNPQYALRESYQMLGGDRTCAAPYLRSRQPHDKSYMPAGSSRSGGKSERLTCGAVATR